MIKNFTDLTDRVAVVIGGTSGLGRVLAAGLAEAGANVVASGRRAIRRTSPTAARSTSSGTPCWGNSAAWTFS